MFPACSFCGQRPVDVWYEGADFKVERESAGEVRSDEAWLACAGCRRLVDADNRERLARLAVRKSRRPEGSDFERYVPMMREHLDRQFWVPREGRDNG